MTAVFDTPNTTVVTRLRDALCLAGEAFKTADDLIAAAIEEGCRTDRQLHLLQAVQATCCQSIAQGTEADAAAKAHVQQDQPQPQELAGEGPTTTSTEQAQMLIAGALGVLDSISETITDQAAGNAFWAALRLLRDAGKALEGVRHV
jgi:hypothetical protein